MIGGLYRIPRFAVVLAAVAAACAEPRATVDPAGRLDVLGPGPEFSADGPGGEWVRVGADDATGPKLSTVEGADGIRALSVTNGARTGILLRRTDAIVAVAPYLSWAWSMAPHAGSEHPVRVVVGFRAGNPADWGGAPAWPGEDLPTYDRLLTLGWDASALRRGHLGPPRENPRAPRHYTVRGGLENAGTWTFETVDLMQIYRQAWPGDDTSSLRVAFIGIAALGGVPPAEARLSGMRLSR